MSVSRNIDLSSARLWISPQLDIYAAPRPRYSGARPWLTAVLGAQAITSKPGFGISTFEGISYWFNDKLAGRFRIRLRRPGRLLPGPSAILLLAPRLFDDRPDPKALERMARRASQLFSGKARKTFAILDRCRYNNRIDSRRVDRASRFEGKGERPTWPIEAPRSSSRFGWSSSSASTHPTSRTTPRCTSASSVGWIRSRAPSRRRP